MLKVEPVALVQTDCVAPDRLAISDLILYFSVT